MERARLITRLYAELVGPRNGVNEILPSTQSPRDEYIVGALEPEALMAPRDPDQDADSLGDESDDGGEDDDADSSTVAVCSSVSPTLLPKSLARSIGISFAVGCTTGAPTVSFCTLWARYLSDAAGFVRQPAHLLQNQVRVDIPMVWRDRTGVEVHMRSRQTRPGVFRVSLFLRNRTVPADSERVAVNEYIFQPEIRVRLAEGTELLPVGTVNSDLNVLQHSVSGNTDGRMLDFLYRGRSAFARGHLCGATWWDIDPERADPGGSSLTAPPFAWLDRATLPPGSAELFTEPEIRTTMLPLLPVQTANMEWRAEYGPPPELDPEVLSELWDPSALTTALTPLVEGYRAWIESQRNDAAAMGEEDRRLAIENLDQCARARDRIADAIHRLRDDDDARLAFCFANRAIKLQARWAGRSNLTWRPFQLAFILLNISALAEPTRADRDICDLLWFPTGGGKTEAYLGLTAFVLALRRRRSLSGDPDWGPHGGGPGVLSRYTLRLLTIQQFRRALGVILAAETMRVEGLNRPGNPVGWRPRNYPRMDDFIWGGIRFSAGLWVGGEVTPNSLRSIGPFQVNGNLKFIAGALDILQGASSRNGYLGPNAALRRNLRYRVTAQGDPAQIAECPCCRNTLAVGDEGLARGRRVLRFLIRAAAPLTPTAPSIVPAVPGVTVASISVTRRPQRDIWLVTIAIDVTGEPLTAREVDEWWYATVQPALGPHVELLSARPARPGYFICTYDNSGDLRHQCDFEIYCLDDDCKLNRGAWAELVPLQRNDRAPRPGGSLITRSAGATAHTNALPGISGMAWQELPAIFRHPAGSSFIGDRVPISALTCDDQIYHRCPSLIIATVDKFARLAYESKSASVFGNVDHFHSRLGYYRENCPPNAGGNLPNAFRAHPAGGHGGSLHVPVPRFRAPDLILQDELHLIEGPLGSLVGLYETAIDALSSNQQNGRRVRPKYAASTATTKEAASQVTALFDRTLAVFPPAGISAEDRFFALDREVHPLDESPAGRLYLGVAAPGRGAQTPIVRIWSVLLQSAFEEWSAASNAVTDQFFTLVGYFNAIRELAGAVSLYRQDIPERMTFRFGPAARRLSDFYLELAGRTPSLDLPARLAQLETPAPLAPTVVCATSMFGTGVDVGRLGLMVVHGQPKNTASYIQAAGRVGRQHGGLVVTFLRASRPRDLDHYEFFTAYHRALNRYVEPVTVAPFSPRARERAIGSLAALLLRQATNVLGVAVDPLWRIQERLSGAYYSEARRMATARHSAEVVRLPRLLEQRAQQQPIGRRPSVGTTARETDSEIDRWALVARGSGVTPNTFVYSESALLNVPTRQVVLGDAQHAAQGLTQVYRHPPQSLRDVEETTGFRT
jgi:hypothetical protein